MEFTAQRRAEEESLWTLDLGGLKRQKLESHIFRGLNEDRQLFYPEVE